MDTALWDALAAPFTPTEFSWRLVKLSPDKLRAQLRPQLPLSAVTGRLDDVLGRSGWSYSYSALGESGVSCTLRIGEVDRAAVVAYNGVLDVVAAAEDALVAAAGCFGLRPGVMLEELPWVDYDAESEQFLYEPELPKVEVSPESMLEIAASPAPSEEKTKSAGQQAIDKLLERLRAEGKGLGAAKLLNTYGGYGSDVQAARELYAKLRALLLEGSAS